MAVVNLVNEAVQIDTTLDNITIVEVLETLRGGKTLNVSGYPLPVIRAGHPIIKSAVSGDYLPMPIVAPYGIKAIGTITAGSGYVAETYKDVDLTTSGQGTGATANIVVGADTGVKSVEIVLAGTGYAVGDTLSASQADLGNAGSGFTVTITEIDDVPNAYGSLPASHSYVGILLATIPTNKPFAGILVRGSVNQAKTPYSMSGIASAFKTALPTIILTED